MSKLPVIRPRELVRALKKLGFLEKRQKGSHLIMVNEDKNKDYPLALVRLAAIPKWLRKQTAEKALGVVGKNRGKIATDTTLDLAT